MLRITLLLLLFANFCQVSAETDNDSSAGFVASSKEKQWSLEINFQNRTLHFFSRGNLKADIITPLPTPSRSESKSILTFSNTDYNNNLITVIIRHDDDDCDDTNPFAHHTTIHVLTPDSSRYTFAGCGSYLGKYRLSERWVLESMNGKTPESSQEGRAPSIEFDFFNNLISGFAGCNRFSGSITFQEEQIRTGIMATTRKACPDMETENEFLKTLSERNLSYEITDLTLNITNGSDVLRFRKVE